MRVPPPKATRTVERAVLQDTLQCNVALETPTLVTNITVFFFQINVYTRPFLDHFTEWMAYPGVDLLGSAQN